MVGNITFLMIFAVFDPSLLTRWMIYILALELVNPGNQHCASCIGTLSFPVASEDRMETDGWTDTTDCIAVPANAVDNYFWSPSLASNHRLRSLGKLEHFYPRESEGLCFYRRWFVCLSVCLSVCLFICYHDN